jgi:hypothetical protein
MLKSSLSKEGFAVRVWLMPVCVVIVLPVVTLLRHERMQEDEGVIGRCGEEVWWWGLGVREGGRSELCEVCF